MSITIEVRNSILHTIVVSNIICGSLKLNAFRKTVAKCVLKFTIQIEALCVCFTYENQNLLLFSLVEVGEVVLKTFRIIILKVHKIQFNKIQFLSHLQEVQCGHFFDFLNI